MTGRSAGDTSMLIQRVNDQLDTDLKRVGALLKRAAARPFSINWRSALRPRYLFAWDDNESDGLTRRHSSTAWLDGARGVSALQVYIFHFCVNGYAFSTTTYGAREDYNHYYQLPIFRPIWNAGAGSVCNFFIISGYALTTNSFRLMREGRYDDLYRGLCSSVLRRWFRLWLPVIACAVPMIFMFQYWPYTGNYQPNREKSLWKETTTFFRLLDDAAQPIPWVNRGGIDWGFGWVNQAWTIPLEFHCSMVCYLVVMLVSRIPVFRHRIAIIGFLAVYLLHHGMFWTFLFLVGMLLAEWDHEQNYQQKTQANGLPWQPNGVVPNGDANHGSSSGGQKQSWTSSRSVSWWSVFNYTIFFIGYYLSGMPMQMQQEDPYTPKIGYEFLYKLQPPKWIIKIDFELRYWQTVSAVCLIYSISQSPSLRRVFETRFCQWLGKMSFALYLVHVQLMGMFAGNLRGFFQYVTSGASGLFLMQFLFELIILTVIVLAMSGFVWRYVDMPTVRFSKWLDEVFTGRKRGGHHRTASEVGGGAPMQELSSLQSSRIEARNH